MGEVRWALYPVLQNVQNLHKAFILDIARSCNVILNGFLFGEKNVWSWLCNLSLVHKEEKQLKLLLDVRANMIKCFPVVVGGFHSHYLFQIFSMGRPHIIMAGILFSPCIHSPTWTSAASLLCTVMPPWVSTPVKTGLETVCGLLMFLRSHSDAIEGSQGKIHIPSTVPQGLQQHWKALGSSVSWALFWMHYWWFF